MDIASAVVAALANGFSSGLATVAKSGVKEAYEAIKMLLRRRYTDVDLKQLEKKPGSKNRRALLCEELESSGALDDDEFLEKVKDLIGVIRAEGTRGDRGIGVDLEEVKAASITIKDIVAGASGVRVRKTETSGDISIQGVHAGLAETQSLTSKKKELTAAASAHQPLSTSVEGSSVGGNLTVTKLYLYLDPTGEARRIALDSKGELSIAKSDESEWRAIASEHRANSNPYKSLEAFQESDADRYFGRDEITTLLWGKLRAFRSPESAHIQPLRILPILGPSGSGKSSLIRAGLIPKLVQNPLPGFGSPRTAVFRPGVRPLEALARVLARIATGNVADVKQTEEFEEALNKMYSTGGHEGLRRIAESLLGSERSSLILFIDQFEEVFSLCQNSDARDCFLNNLIDAAGDPGGAVSVILTLRSDFLEATVQHQMFNQAVSKLAVIVPVMSEQERREAIERPAAQAGNPIDTATVDLLIEQTNGREGALPLLQFVLSRIWENLEQGITPAKTVRDVGGVGGALAGEAQAIYDALDSVEQRIGRRAFLSLIQLSEGARASLRRSYLSDMTAHSEVEADVRRVLEYFANPGRRLITLSADPSGATTVELTHEALVENWGTLRNWIAESREDIRLHRRVAESARNWDMYGRPDGLLWRSPDLDLLKRFGSRPEHDLTEIETAFYEAAKDLEEQERKEKKQRVEKERQYTQNQNILDAVGQLSVGIVILNDADIIQQINRGFQGMTDAADGGVGRPCYELFGPDDQSALSTLLGHCKREHTPAPSVEVRPICTREPITLLSAIRLEDQLVDGRTLLCLIDITEQRKLEAQLVQSQKMQAVSQLAGGIAHDFNNVLAAIIGFCDLLLQRHRPGDQSFVDIMQIKQSANHAASLVRQLLAFSRQQTLQPRLLDVTEVLAELSNLLRRLLGEKSELVMVHGRDLGLVKGDQGQLEQVIINLAVNARDAMEGGGMLTVETKNVDTSQPRQAHGEVMPAGEYVQISVRDTGMGIPKKNFARIFEPFFTTKEVGSGTGLGLSAVYGIIKQTGGYLFVDSPGEGQGTVFDIFFARQHAAALSAVDDAHAEIAADMTGSGTVLMVDCEDAVRLFSARALRNLGYKVIEAETGQAALELLNGGDFDLLITELMMPLVDGAQVIHEAREQMPHLPVICISGYAKESVIMEVESLDHLRFLSKPFSLKQLAGAVQKSINAV